MGPSIPDLTPTRCAICGTEGNARILYEARLPANSFSPEIFSARREPDRIHYRIVKCRACDLVRSDPILDEDSLVELYSGASFDYQEELENLKKTYRGALDRLFLKDPSHKRLLDVGCGNGFVLEEALRAGWEKVAGFEPTTDAVTAAAPGVRDSIITGPLVAGQFEAGSFSAITLFQVLDHLSDPLEALQTCADYLEPGGVMLIWNHNVAALSARLLGERSPIFDVEHTYLYSPRTLSRLIEAAGLSVLEVGSVRNTYSIPYFLRLAPLPTGLEASAGRVLKALTLDSSTLNLPLGNMALIARKPL